MHRSALHLQRKPRQACYTAAAVALLLIIGCATTYSPKYQNRAIQKQSENQPKATWVYPSYTDLKQIKPLAGVNGVEKPRPLPSFVPDREPAFASGMTLLSDGSIVFVSPLEYAYEPKKFTIATYYRERITKVKVYRFDAAGGSETWSRTLPVEGVYDTTEINSTLLFSAKNFDKFGEFIDTTLVALDIASGKELWRRQISQPFRHFTIDPEHNLIVFATKSDKDTASAPVVEAIDVATGARRWSAPASGETTDAEAANAWPAIVGKEILLFEDSISLRRLNNGALVWERKDIKPAGNAQPQVFRNTVWLQTESGLTAIDASTGKTKWNNGGMSGELMKLSYSGKHLYASLSEEGFFSATHNLAMLDLPSGRIIWKIKTEPLLGNIVENNAQAHFTTAEQLVSINLKDGSTGRTTDLPWEDVFSHHVLTIRGDALTVKNEWNVAMWKMADHTMVYHHPFEPLCPIMTTNDRMLEQKAIGASVSSTTASAATYNYYIDTAYFSSQFNSAMNSYRSTGDSSYLHLAEANYGMTRYAMAQNRALAGMQFGMTMAMATMQIGTAVIHNKVQVTSSMIYPKIDAVMKKFRIYDNGDYVVRLVGVENGGQRFSALQVVHEDSGRSAQLLLSPSQMPSELTTFARSAMTAQELNGYYSASMYLGHSYSTVVDLERKRVIHYGPGLNTNEYITYGSTGFVRGRIFSLPMPLP